MGHTSTAIGVMLIAASLLLMSLATFPWEVPEVIVMFDDRVHVAEVVVMNDVCFIQPEPAARLTPLQAEGKLEYAGRPGVWTLYTGGGRLDPARTATWFKENCAGVGVAG